MLPNVTLKGRKKPGKINEYTFLCPLSDISLDLISSSVSGGVGVKSHHSRLQCNCKCAGWTKEANKPLYTWSSKLSAAWSSAEKTNRHQGQLWGRRTNSVETDRLRIEMSKKTTDSVSNSRQCQTVDVHRYQIKQYFILNKYTLIFPN